MLFISAASQAHPPCVWKPKDNFVEVASSFHLYMDLGDRTQPARLAHITLLGTDVAFCCERSFRDQTEAGRHMFFSGCVRVEGEVGGHLSA